MFFDIFLNFFIPYLRGFPWLYKYQHQYSTTLFTWLGYLSSAWSNSYIKTAKTGIENDKYVFWETGSNWHCLWKTHLSFSRPAFHGILTWWNLKVLAELANLTVSSVALQLGTLDKVKNDNIFHKKKGHQKNYCSVSVKLPFVVRSTALFTRSGYAKCH